MFKWVATFISATIERIGRTDLPTQQQAGGAGSVNVQAGAITVGVSYAEARQIALDVYKANALELAHEAKQLAIARAEELTDDFLVRLQAQNPVGLEQARTPDFQSALYDAQKAYAKTGDKELENLLVDILVSRTKQPSRSLREIALSESLQVVPRLTPQQIHTIAVIFLLRYTQNYGIVSLERFDNWFKTSISPFLPSLTKSPSHYQHLAYSGAATIELGSVGLGDAFRQTYPGLFSNGRPKGDYEKFTKNYPAIEAMFGPAIHNSANVQLPPMPKPTLEQALNAMGVPKTVQDELWQMQVDVAKPANEVADIWAARLPDFATLRDIWEHSQLQNAVLTSVGLAIGHATFQQVTGQQADLGIWLPD